MGRILFVCKTPYQILTAARIVESKYMDIEVDVILADTIANVVVLKQRILNSKIFKNVYLHSCSVNSNLHGVNKALRFLSSKTDVKCVIPYDAVYLANVYDWTTNTIIRKLRKKNPNIQIYMFEDGFATYSHLYGDFMKLLHSSSLIKKFYYKRIYSEYYYLAGLYLFTPSLLDWKPDFPVYEIDKIGENDTDFKRCINALFSYENMKDNYNEKFIFFEESYYADNVNIDDLFVIKQVERATGVSNLFVKTHPRNSFNRFCELGYQTNKTTVIPWEVIALNIDISNKVLVTIASGSALTSLVNMKSMPLKIIMLMDCEEIPDEKLTPTLPTLRKIAYAYPDQVYLPKNLEELMTYIKFNYGVD